jgi:hypothetical protein
MARFAKSPEKYVKSSNVEKVKAALKSSGHKEEGSD